jgi:hypothetical protein
LPSDAGCRAHFRMTPKPWRALISLKYGIRPRPPRGRQAGNIALLAAKIEALKAEIARLEARAADHRADFERERADRLAVELLQATAETMAANEVTARLEDEVAALRTGGRAGGSIDSRGQAASRLGHLAATIVEADRKACR